MPVNSFEITNINYTAIVWYRKRWFIFLTLILFTPATILICLTGDIYAKREESTYKFGKDMKYCVVAAATLFLIQAVIRTIS